MMICQQDWFLGSQNLHKPILFNAPQWRGTTRIKMQQISAWFFRCGPIQFMGVMRTELVLLLWLGSWNEMVDMKLEKERRGRLLQRQRKSFLFLRGRCFSDSVQSRPLCKTQSLLPNTNLSTNYKLQNYAHAYVPHTHARTPKLRLFFFRFLFPSLNTAELRGYERQLRQRESHWDLRHKERRRDLERITML